MSWLSNKQTSIFSYPTLLSKTQNSRRERVTSNKTKTKRFVSVFPTTDGQLWGGDEAQVYWARLCAPRLRTGHALERGSYQTSGHSTRTRPVCCCCCVFIGEETCTSYFPHTPTPFSYPPTCTTIQRFLIKWTKAKKTKKTFTHTDSFFLPANFLFSRLTQLDRTTGYLACTFALDKERVQWLRWGGIESLFSA